MCACGGICASVLMPEVLPLLMHANARARAHTHTHTHTTHKFIHTQTHVCVCIRCTEEEMLKEWKRREDQEERQDELRREQEEKKRLEAEQLQLEWAATKIQKVLRRLCAYVHAHACVHADVLMISEYSCR